MTTQRIAGAWLSAFTAGVILNHAVQGSLSGFDFLYVGFLIPLTASAFWERKVLKVFQVGVSFLTGVILTSFNDSRDIGFTIMAFSHLYSYVYGLLVRHFAWKMIALGVVYFGVFSWALSNGGNGFMWVFMCATIHGAIWLAARDAARDAATKQAHLEELENIVLKQELLASEELIKSLGAAGMRLIREIKERRGRRGERHR